MIESMTKWSRAEVADHYDDLDDFYREIWGEHLHHGLWRRGDETAERAVIQLVHEVARAANVAPGKKVCDVGAGYGATARLVAETYEASVTALTISPAQYEYARTQGADHRIEYVLEDWFDNGFSAESFDAVIAVESTAHMEDKPGFFREAHRILRPGGRLVVCAWLADPEADAWQERHLLEPICRDGRLPGLGTASEYEQWIRDAGMDLQQSMDRSANVQKTWTVCLRRVLGRLVRDSRYVRFLLDPSQGNRRFALAMLRIWLAYRVGAMRYGFFVAEKPS